MELSIGYLMNTCPNKACSFASIVADSAAINALIVIFGSMIKLFIDTLVAINKIDSVEQQRIFIGKVIIPIGDTYKDEFMKLVEH